MKFKNIEIGYSYSFS